MLIPHASGSVLQEDMLTSAMTSAPGSESDVQALVEAYKVLDLELQVSPLAIEHSHREV